ncbi:MAG TPA: trypsin-like serine protease [Oligoflexus sp.]|uniref:S1 family peptidase n=1 Tax=Oligoflexus sp. TaxID=1971216 RepID=UPI002D7E4E54|nr:trypsin-like serine protease [Oligoflexus sp.]HET9240805.1 trypsin-like serine protease [Oligoflexus sp.]
MLNGKPSAMLSFLCVLALLSCARAPESVSTPKIIQGHAAEALSYPVVALLKEDSGGVWYAYCSGVMIAADRLLTAAHCTQSSLGEVYEASSLRVQWGQKDPEADLSQALAVASVFVHPHYNPAAMGKDKDGLIKPGAAYDIALWTLQQPITNPLFHPAAIMPPAELSASLQNEQEILLLGYGQTSAWGSPWEKRQLMEAITLYKPRLVWNVRRRELVNGRLITRTVSLEFPGATEVEFYAGDRHLPDTCKGDSGGPAMMKDAGGEWKLLGLTSRGDANCDRGGVYTLVPLMQSWFAGL